MALALLVERNERMVLPTGLYAIYLVDAIGKVAQLVAREDDEVVARLLCLSREVIRAEGLETLVNEHDGIMQPRELIFPVDVREGNALPLALNAYA